MVTRLGEVLQTIGGYGFHIYDDGSLFLLTRPASNSANQARNLSSSAGGSRRIASSISSTVMATGIARRASSLKKQWPANRDLTVLRRWVIEVGR
jgi:hypothetical protein